MVCLEGYADAAPQVMGKLAKVGTALLAGTDAGNCESDAPSQGATMVRDSVVERHFSPFLLNFDLLYFTFDP